MQMPVSTSHPNKQLSIPLSALQLPGHDEQVASEEFLSHLPSQVSSCEVALSPSVNPEPEVSSSQEQPPVATTITTEAPTQCIPDQDERAAELSREQNEKTIQSTQTVLHNFHEFLISKYPSEIRDLYHPLQGVGCLPCLFLC
ncbi:hypothetical protein SUZIE_133875 [Sciurus carolinensis]|uniref:Uncharacterized protein n=1 Tax=Sciurus carolinensis TaxID=30640 RepID=A0AA41SWL1_SCICA|nr:hypothetical protein [Sciurus carolinensis]